MESDHKSFTLENELSLTSVTDLGFTGRGRREGLVADGGGWEGLVADGGGWERLVADGGGREGC